ncbi:hypothetical protein CHS0354_010332 [Potamilus streckersoni]|uniref:Uncharacterized protein n=1 Tax=Potamilus streckersoni TaxID=2493646 RepID=A0AAE0TEM0_9BIVA|nr:hypothetical protein CHS0354_010332 [Potamilus streckersoni]
MYGINGNHLSQWKMGSNLWHKVESVQLLQPEDFMQERQWEEEVKLRKIELLQQKRQFEEKRKINELRFEEITRRWRNLEDKRIRKSEEYMGRMTTSLSLITNRQY